MPDTSVLSSKKPKTPKTHQDAAVLVSKVAEKLRSMSRIESRYQNEIAAHEAEIAKLRRKEAEEIEPHMDEAVALSSAIHAFAMRHREELTKGGVKTVTLPTGDQFRWRITPYAATIVDEAKLIEEIERLSKKYRDRYLKRTVEVRRKPLIDDRETPVVERLAHLRITAGEKFEILPKGMEERFEAALGEHPMQWQVCKPEKHKKRKAAP